MQDVVIDTDVLIVGAGPVGLFLANECARRGLRWRLVETRASQSVHSKALAIFPRTLEIFDMSGVVYFQYLQNRSEKMYVHALHTVHSLPDLGVAGGRLGDVFHHSKHASQTLQFFPVGSP